MKWLGYAEIFISIQFFSPLDAQQGRCNSEEEFQCQQSGVCIDKKYVCDGIKDCAGGSDEDLNLCLHRSCSRRLDFTFEFKLIDIAEASNSFRCDYGACIPKLFVCNGLMNCVDGSDEAPKYCKNLKCKNHQFKCKYGACIKQSAVCNGRSDCLDGSDETEKLCKKWTTSCRRRFRCSYGACIKQRLVCNGKVDCMDESDESKSKCGKNHVYTPVAKYAPPPVTEPPLTTPAMYVLTAPPFKSILEVLSSGNLNPNDLQQLLPFLQTGTTSTTTRSISSFDNNKNFQGNSFCNFQISEVDAVKILFCGSYHPSDVQRKCIFEGKVPASTIVLVDCWETTSMISVCQPDGQWMPINETDTRMSMNVLCQPSSLYSKICGRFSYLKQFRRSKMDVPYKWPFLAGIFKNKIFTCTGTIITNQWILTAAHCFPNYKNSEFSFSSFGIQLSTSTGLENLNTVSLIYTHPKFEMLPYLVFDIALMKLSEPIFFTKNLYPACIDTGVALIYQFAATFIRNEGENAFSWKLNREQLDASCFNRESECSKHISIGHNQFCTMKSDDPVELKPNANSTSKLARGSSGGPFLLNIVGDNDDQWAVVAVVSYLIDTKGCPSYTVFSSLSESRQWIEYCVNKGFCSKLILH